MEKINFKYEFIGLLIIAFLLDLCLGDPEFFPHPVKEIGRLITFLEKILAKPASDFIIKIRGIVLLFLVVIVSGIIVWGVIKIAFYFNFYLGCIATIYFSYTAIAVKDLKVKANQVSWALKNNSLDKAKIFLKNLVGRDTQNLSEEKIIAATLESVAENTSDGIIAPLFYLILGGPVLAFVYKAVNTMDSRIGYKNKKYINLGWAAAKLDDFLNFLPARITGFLICCVSFISGRGFIYPFKIMLRDGRKHLSPNSGIPEAALAGALKIKLGGPNFYAGKQINKPYLGEEKNNLSINLIYTALNISLISSFLMLYLGVFFLWKI